MRRVSRERRIGARGGVRVEPLSRVADLRRVLLSGLADGQPAVLPFPLAAKGISWAAGMLYPVSSIGVIAGNALSPPAVARLGRRRNVGIATAAATFAILTACIAAADLCDVLVAPIFLWASLVIGCAMGIANNAYAEIISRTLDRERRSRLLLNQEAIGAVLTVAGTLLILPLMSGRP